LRVEFRPKRHSNDLSTSFEWAIRLSLPWISRPFNTGGFNAFTKLAIVNRPEGHKSAPYKRPEKARHSVSTGPFALK
jgi:hypothetical protein